MALKTTFTFRLIWGILMVVIYLGMFFLLVFTPLFKQYVPLIRYVFGGVFLLYGVYRAWRIWTDRK